MVCKWSNFRLFAKFGEFYKLAPQAAKFSENLYYWRETANRFLAAPSTSLKNLVGAKVQEQNGMSILMPVR